MAAADGPDSRPTQQYIQIGKWAGKGKLDDIMNSIGETDADDRAHAVRCASQHSHIHVMEALLPSIYGADHAGQSGFTALHFAIYGHATPETIQVLIDAGACPLRIPSTKKSKENVDAFEQLSKENIEPSKKEHIRQIMSAHRCSGSCQEDAKKNPAYASAAIVDMTRTPIIPSVDSHCHEEPAGVWMEPNEDDDELPKTNEEHANHNKIPRLR